MRIHHFDFSRTVLFGLGIVLHAAWFCRQESRGFQGLHDFIHSFRMQAFFLIAGFFSATMLAKRSPEEFLSRRLQRLGIPLLFCGLVINPIANCANLANWADFSSELSRDYWLNGRWLQHLWFLTILITYVVLLVAAQLLLPDLNARLKRLRLSLPAFLGLATAAFFATTHVNKVCPIGFDGIVGSLFQPYDALKYATFFAAGYFLFHRAELLDDLSGRPWFNGLSAVAYWLVTPWLARLFLGKYVVQAWQAVYCLNMCGLLFWLAKRHFNTGNALVRSFSDASYTVYLVHYPIMIMLNRAFGGPLPPALTFGLLVVLTSVLSFAVHVCVVQRSGLLSVLLNGQYRALDLPWSRLAGKPA